jgi:hypothetical protein
LHGEDVMIVVFAFAAPAHDNNHNQGAGSAAIADADFPAASHSVSQTVSQSVYCAPSPFSLSRVSTGSPHL